MSRYFGLFLFLFCLPCYSDIILERVGEAAYRQLNLERKIEELIERRVDPELRVKIGKVSYIINMFIQQRIEMKWDFP